MTAKWIGKSGVLPVGAVVEVLAIDEDDCEVPARAACWVKYRPDGCERPQYRSCDLGDLEMPPPEPYIMNPGGLGPDDLVNPAPSLIIGWDDIPEGERWRYLAGRDAPISGSIDCEDVRRLILSTDEPPPVLPPVT